MLRSGRPVHISSSAVIWTGTTSAAGNAGGTSIVDSRHRFDETLLLHTITLTSGGMAGTTRTYSGPSGQPPNTAIVTAGFGGQVAAGTTYTVSTPQVTDTPTRWNIPKRKLVPSVAEQNLAGPNWAGGAILTGLTREQHRGGRTKQFRIRNIGSQLLHVSFDSGMTYYTIAAGGEYVGDIEITHFWAKAPSVQVTDFTAVAILN